VKNNLEYFKYKKYGCDSVRVFGLFDKYFLILMIIQGMILTFYDGGIFKRKDENQSMKQARSIGVSAIILSIALYIVSRFA
jgi:hypothetical protein